MTTRVTTETCPEGTKVCWKCSGSGLFYKGGMVENGRYTGETGMCFPCRGKGYMTKSDTKRTECYYKYHYRAYA